MKLFVQTIRVLLVFLAGLVAIQITELGENQMRHITLLYRLIARRWIEGGGRSGDPAGVCKEVFGFACQLRDFVFVVLNRIFLF